ncbi:MAG: protein translocase subunit SecD [Chloroflexi bacterium]|nr:protein translocase subunit SecD [Chloroflexota bacterium]
MRRINWKTLVIIVLMVGIAVASISVQRISIPVPGGDFARGGKSLLGLQLGLDLQGGVHLVYEAAGVEPTDEQMEGVMSTIRRRVDAFGVTEPVIQRMGTRRVLVQLPGVTDVGQAKQLIGQTARLEFKERTCEDIECAKFTDKDTGLTGEDLARAFAGQHPTTGQAVVNFEFKSSAARVFGELTTRIAGTNNRIAVFLDDTELIAPVARQAILTGTGFIEGRFTTEEARTLAIQLESGRLPVPIEVIQERDVDATLGAESLRQSLVAGLIGFGLVVFFMLAYYKVPGVVAVLALLTYSVFMLAVFKLVPVTLTVAGVAAFVLSLGMAVDANVLIFERMKEELRQGRTLLASMQIGFSRAWPSIRDSNFTTFIICAVLFWFGKQFGATQVTGFALTLFIGVATSMFTAIVVTRNLLGLAALLPVRHYPGLFSPEGAPRRAASPEEGRPRPTFTERS